MGGNKVKKGDVLILTPKSEHGKEAISCRGCVVKVKYLQPGKFCVEHYGQAWRWINEFNDEDFDWEYKETRDNLLDRTEALAMKRAIGHPTDLLGNNMETPKERVERWNFEINN